ncbi:ABC transporter permease [Alkalibacterium sp. f15]|uniref:ABC transporter permease n=1 Tax=Alkalibacterium sp. f15 TaxID=3414029 RepID=UPI003BF89928
MRIRSLILRILRQFKRDKRTMALLILAPILVLSLLYLVFGDEGYTPRIGLVDIPEQLTERVDLSGAEVTLYTLEDSALADVEAQVLDGYVSVEANRPSLTLEGSDPTINSAVLRWMQEAFSPLSAEQENQFEINFIHGDEDMRHFDYFGPVLLGFFVFFFVFLISGVSFLRERTRGTLERLLSSPLRKWEIVIGYVVGFGLFTVIQSTIISAYSIYVLGMMMEGNFFYVLLITLCLSFTALTLGILLSSFAQNELQMIQFIPVVVVPQLFFSGLFNLETISGWVSWIGPLTPLYYAAEALRDVMVRGFGFQHIMLNLLVLLGFSVVFVVLNILVLNQHRKV